LSKDIKDYGTIKHWRDSFGFIAPDGSAAGDVFSQIAPGLQPRRGACVSHYLAPDKPNPSKVMAVDVTILKESLHQSLDYSFNQVQQSKSENAYPGRSNYGR
jgi:hypothetical protein